MKIAVCHLTSEVAVIGSRTAVRIGPGAQVDLDQVIGDGVRLEEALGRELVDHFTLVPVEAAPLAKVGRSTRTSEPKE